MVPFKHSFQSLVLLSLLWLIFYSSAAYAASTSTEHATNSNKPIVYTNLTISVPEGTYVTDTHLLCLPASYNTVIFFFIGNYFSHATTVSSDAGASIGLSLANIIFALILPGTGLIRGMFKIKRMAGFGASPLQRAARAGAVCIVVRNEDWKPVPGQKIYGGRFVAAGDPSSTEESNGEKGKAKDKNAALYVKFDHNSAMAANTRDWRDRKVKAEHEDPSDPSEGGGISTAPVNGHQYSYVEDQMIKYRRRVHGSFRLPVGYSFRVLRGNIQVFSPDKPVPGDPKPTNPDVSASYNLAKSLIAFAQLILAFTTLLRSKGDQIDRYGYAAFGLTVTPYAIASLVSLASNCITPDYPSLFMVRNDVMIEAEAVPDAGGFFDGVVGFIKEDPEDSDYIHSAHMNEGNIVLTKSDISTEYTASERAGDDIHALDVQACGTYITLERWMDWQGWDQVFKFLTFFLLCLPLIIIGSLTGFKKQESTLAQRVWLMCWLIFGSFWAVLGSWKNRNIVTLDKTWLNGLFFAIFSVFPVGSFVVVAKMILDYGDCLALSSG